MSFQKKDFSPPIPIKSKPAPSLPDLVEQLELSGGNLDTFLDDYRGLEEPLEREAFLFSLYKELYKQENKEYLTRWNEAIHLSGHIRLQLLQCRAFRTLEKFNSQTEKSSSPEISYANVILKDILETKLELAKQRLQTRKEEKLATEPDELDKDIEMLQNPI
jgi:hypothetical protein